MDGVTLWNGDLWFESPILWIVVSVAVAALAFWARDAYRRGKLENLEVLVSMPGMEVLSETIRAIYFLLPPFGLMAMGWLSPALVGTSEGLWLPRLFDGLGVSAMLLPALLAAVWLSRWQAKFPPVRRSWIVGVREAVYRQSHWAFYRAAWGAAGLEPYAATWAGVVTVLAEWAADPGNYRTEARRRVAMRIALLFSTTAVFLVSGNLWLCMAFHWLAVWLLGEEW